MSIKAVVNRVEVIDHSAKTDTNQPARAYTFWRDDDVEVEFQLQDDGRTLKIFISELPDDAKSKKT